MADDSLQEAVSDTNAFRRLLTEHSKELHEDNDMESEGLTNEEAGLE